MKTILLSLSLMIFLFGQAQTTAHSNHAVTAELKKYAYLSFGASCVTSCDSAKIKESGLRDTFQNSNIDPQALNEVAIYAMAASKGKEFRECNCLSRSLEFFLSRDLDQKVKAVIKKYKL
ncbi:MAG: hypothetical protein ACJ749_16070 [Flavisolibacter sp.]